MNHTEACQILGISTNASEDEINTAFRKLAAKAHPDVNKAPDAEENFKKLNEAYQYLKNPKQQDPTDIPMDFSDMFDFVFRTSGFGKRSWQHVYYSNHQTFSPPPSICNITLEFAESVLGCTKQITYNENIICVTCNGSKYINNDSTTQECNGCSGKGVRFYGSVGTQSDQELPCQQCKGTGNISSKINCPDCQCAGYTQQFAQIKINFPPGITNGSILTVTNNNKKIKINCSVKSDPDMILMGADIVSNLELSLLEALEGTTKSVRTVMGEKVLKIKPGIKHAEVIKVSKFGVPNLGNHLFKVSIKYPDDCSKLIEILRDIDKSKEENKDS